MQSKISNILVAAMAAAGIAMATPVAAQSQGQAQGNKPPMPAPQQQAPKVDASQAEVSQFADIYKQSVAIRKEKVAAFKAAEDKEEQKKIRNSMRTEMQQVIADSPLSMDRYRKIARAASADPELRKRIQQAVQPAGQGAVQP